MSSCSAVVVKAANSGLGPCHSPEMLLFCSGPSSDGGEEEPSMPPNSSASSSAFTEPEDLRAVALDYLIKSQQSEGALALDADAGDSGKNGSSGWNLPEVFSRAGKRKDLPENVFDVDQMLEKVPMLKKDNAFFDTMNADSTIRCPYVLNKPGHELGGMEAIVRFGKATAGHPQTVHGGVAALTFDTLLGMCLFMQGTGPVFTAYLKVEYKAPLPVETTASLDVTIDRVEGRKLFVTGRLMSAEKDILFSSAEALFVKPMPTSDSGAAPTRQENA